jgi:hypothetical protein
MTASATASRPASAPKAKAKVTAPVASANEVTINRDAQERLTYGDACKLISRLLIKNPSGAEATAAIRVIIDGVGLPSQFVDTQAES